MTKTCSTCSRHLPLESFANNKHGRGGKHSKCKECANKSIREWRANNKERVANQSLLYKYGLTPGEYSSLLLEQGCKCAICGTEKPGGRGVFYVDHCHTTGKIRGLLCHACNTMLGMARDNPVTLRKAADYLGKG